MKKICVCGSFGFGKDSLDGQTVKTKSIYDEMEKRVGKKEITTIDTVKAKKQLIVYPFILGNALKSCENILILPAHNGLKVIAPILAIENVFFRRKLHYAVVGGWLPKYLKNRFYLRKCLKRFTGIYVETNTMKTELEKMGFDNVLILPNFKKLNILTEEEISEEFHTPYELCTFSRVMKQKGIEDAIYAVVKINEKYKKEIYKLDIYGQVEKGEEIWFEKLCENIPSCITYKGTVPYDQSVDVIKKYFALVFPTLFYTEGIPGTIIDAYAAGVPVISSCWESYADVVEEGVTGLGYEFENREELVNLLDEVFNKPDILIQKKKACLQSAKYYTADVALLPLLERI